MDSVPYAAGVVLAALLLVVGPVAGAALGVAPTGDAATANASVDAPAPDASGDAATADVRAEASLQRASTANGTADAEGRPDNGTIDLTQSFHLTPDRPGTVEVRLTWRIPDHTESLETYVPPGSTVLGTEGFSQAGRETYAWDNRTTRATITYRITVNETVRAAGPESAQGRYLFADVGEWAMLRRPQVQAQWTWRGPPAVALNRSFTTDGPGKAGEWMVYLGAQRTYTDSAHNQTFRLVVPERATMAERPAAVLQSLAAASDRLRVGDRDERVTVFVTPTTQVEWGVRGIQYGDADMWVRDVERLDTAENTWLHEYVHSRQDFETTAATRWITEGSATYYAALLALEQDRIGLEAFREHLRSGTRRPQSEAVLADPGTWRNGANYLKGMLVAGDLDRRVREASDGTRSLQAVLSAMNVASDPVGQETWLALVGGVSDASVRRTADRFTTTTDAPSVWSADEHRDAFGADPALPVVRLRSGPDAHRVSGPYRNGTVGDAPTVYLNETLTVRATLYNAGGATVEASGTFGVDGVDAETVGATLAPGQRREVTLDRTFTEAGRHTITFGGDELTVLVSQPARASVVASSVNRTDLDAPGTVEVTATVANDASFPGEKTVTFRKDGDGFAKRTVRLGAGERETVAVTVALESTGEYALRAGRDDPVTVTVGDGPGGTDAGGNGSTDGGEADGTDGGDGAESDGGDGGSEGTDGDGSVTEFGPGFGGVAALLSAALTLLALAVARRRR